MTHLLFSRNKNNIFILHAIIEILDMMSIMNDLIKILHLFTTFNNTIKCVLKRVYKYDRHFLPKIIINTGPKIFTGYIDSLLQTLTPFKFFLKQVAVSFVSEFILLSHLLICLLALTVKLLPLSTQLLHDFNMIQVWI